MLLKTQNISKFYPGVKALQNINFSIDKGEIVSVVGENGAGKSTLMKILSGAISPSEGQIFMDDSPVVFTKPTMAQNMGISTIHQELMIIPELSVVENVFMGALKRGFLGILDWQNMALETEKLLAKLGLKLDVFGKAGNLSVAEQQLLEIARSIRRNSRLLIMDEPTASLSREETENLFNLVRSLRKQGIAVILITHHLNEIFELCDRAFVLRDGQYSGKSDIQDLTETKLIEMMLGAELVQNKGEVRKYTQNPEIVLETKNVTRTPALKNISIQLHRGEVLGIAGLMGAGRTELVRVLYGADVIDSGEIHINGEITTLKNPRDAIDNAVGLAPEDRKTQGLILSMSIAHNVTMSSLKSYSGLLGLSLSKEKKDADKFCTLLETKHTGVEYEVGTLSGGNQQKVVLAKLLGAGTDIYLLDEPTRGIDVGAKKAISNLIWDITNRGSSVIIISSAIEELITVCDRIVCMHQGEITQTYDRKDFDLNKIMLSSMGNTDTMKGNM